MDIDLLYDQHYPEKTGISGKQHVELAKAIRQGIDHLLQCRGVADVESSDEYWHFTCNSSRRLMRRPEALATSPLRRNGGRWRGRIRRWRH